MSEATGDLLGKGLPELLVVAEEASERRSIAAALGDGFALRLLPPSALRSTAASIDVACAIALLDTRRPETELEALAPLRDLAAGRALILLVAGPGDERARQALALLAPARVLAHPVPAALLRFNVDSVLEASARGKGARDAHRPAVALLGVSAAIRELLDQIRRVAPTRSPVLVLGETGTGKELVARAVHAGSPRAARPFVAVNCGALPAALLESELFGHARGAFTGADRARRGLLEEAHEGTLFLDEIGDMPAELQVKLLRALETGEVRPLGSSGVRSVDVRIISATHRDLEAAIEAGEFRQDLYYRINTVSLYLPPLRRRRVDIPFLAQHFAETFGAANARRIVLDEAFIEAISRLDFPGNVRELRNNVERAIALAQPGERVGLEHLPPAPRRSTPPAKPPPAGTTLREAVDELERELIASALARHAGNRTRPAAELGLSRLGLRKKLERLSGAPRGD